MNVTTASSAKDAAMRGGTHPSGTRIVAHRGGAALWPENTMRAFKGAIALGVDAIELDVHPSADGVPMVIHDATLERTGLGRGVVVEQLASFFAEGAVDIDDDVRAPRLSEALALIADAPLGVSVELKVNRLDQRYPALAERVVTALDDADLLNRAFVHAFDWGYLGELQALAPELALGANVEQQTLARFAGWEALLDAVAALEVRDLNADHRLVDDLVLDQARERGLGVTLWTVNDDDAIRRFLDAEIDNLCTDRPDRALELRSAR